MNKFSKYVGLDVHQETIAVAVADMAGEVRYMGEIVNTPEAIAKVVARLKRGTGTLAFCYEAGPCGYTICRQQRWRRLFGQGSGVFKIAFRSAIPPC